MSKKTLTKKRTIKKSAKKTAKKVTAKKAIKKAVTKKTVKKSAEKPSILSSFTFDEVKTAIEIKNLAVKGFTAHKVMKTSRQLLVCLTSLKPELVKLGKYTFKVYTLKRVFEFLGLSKYLASNPKVSQDKTLNAVAYAFYTLYTDSATFYQGNFFARIGKTFSPEKGFVVCLPDFDRYVKSSKANKADIDVAKKTFAVK